MKLRFLVLSSLLLVLIAGSTAQASTGDLGPATGAAMATVTPSGAGSSNTEPGVDPFYGLGDLTSKAVPVAFCPCLIGVNCCGDPEAHGNNCSIKGRGCKCNANNDCINPPGIHSAN